MTPDSPLSTLVPSFSQELQFLSDSSMQPQTGRPVAPF